MSLWLMSSLLTRLSLRADVRNLLSRLTQTVSTDVEVNSDRVILQEEESADEVRVKW